MYRKCIAVSVSFPILYEYFAERGSKRTVLRRFSSIPSFFIALPYYTGKTIRLCKIRYDF